MGSKLKQFVISVGLFLVSSVASANLVQHTITQTTPQASRAENAAIGHAISTLAHTHLLSDKPSKTEVIYSTLFEYSSHINQTIDHSGLSVFWNHALISTGIDAAQAQQHWDNAHVTEDSELSSFVANSLNDDYVATNKSDTRINEVPLPAAIWLFSSAIMLFGFARRGTV